jgi:hypothetical protein
VNIALSAFAGIMFLSGCAYDSYYDRYAYNYDYDYGYRPFHHFYFQDGVPMTAASATRWHSAAKLV